ncbi:Leucine-rich repeat receptor-like protein kinase family protein [Hibiscus syriacus]|uniref:Leucine-rich repeat receptor-like protein kinase family protein n=1 Tax=Hibiscus syriacus TaxID=106335 RepID=A0A6A2ZCM9_HIBSY|nr:protein Mpv17-like [Hibiscus syriacus]KAE8689240.1 Leucine-rich repeat receptor-like protein kinase family protein [Hibiscus syriacus]
MEALGGNGAFWGWKLPDLRSPKRPSPSKSKSSDSTGGWGPRFPLKQAVTAASLALTGDTIAQLNDRWRKRKHSVSDSSDTTKDIMSSVISHHDWLRALRMTSYGFLLYGPGSYAWYKYLDHCLPHQTAQNIMLKVLLNQVVLGPCVIAVVFAWNNLWLGKLSELPSKYQKDALPTLFYGFRFWIPVSLLNFWVVPLQARVAFMSTGSIFWNFYLSSTMSK